MRLEAHRLSACPANLDQSRPATAIYERDQVWKNSVIGFHSAAEEDYRAKGYMKEAVRRSGQANKLVDSLTLIR